MVLADVEELEDGGDRLLDDRRVKAVDDARAVFLSDDEPGVFEDVEVAGEGAGGELELLGQLAGSHLALAKEPQDFTARGVAEGLEGGVHWEGHYFGISPISELYCRAQIAARGRLGAARRRALLQT